MRQRYLKAWLGHPHGMKVYPGAKHAFFNDQWRAAAFRSGAGSRSTTC
jgi:dienelactone hydrolase